MRDQQWLDELNAEIAEFPFSLMHRGHNVYAVRDLTPCDTRIILRRDGDVTCCFNKRVAIADFPGKTALKNDKNWTEMDD